jgi:mono/diheme cytochrome c family protein
MATIVRAIAAAAAAALVVAIAGCGGDSSDTVEQETATAGAPEAPQVEQPLSAAERHGRDLFVANCGSCHTLDAAGTIGQIGPNLGDIALTEQGVLTAIRIGGGRHSKGAGGRSGNMPPNLVTGQDAKDVAAFVAANASGSSTP